MERLRGPIPPVITPFRADGEVDFEAFIFNLDKWKQAGIRTILLFGSNGETPLLERAEKLKLLQRAADHCGDEVTLLAGTGLESTRATLEFTREAALAGASGALVLTPHFYRPQMDDEALRTHFRTLADADILPVLIYNVPKYTGLNVSSALLRDLSRHPRIVGMKDSSGDIAQFVRFQSAALDDFQVLPGTASIWYPALVLGAEAGIMALANCAPEACLQVYDWFMQERWEEAEFLYRKLLPVNTAVTATYGIAGLKHACSLRGYRAGSVRPPLRALPAGQATVIEKLLEAAQIA